MGESANWMNHNNVVLAPDKNSASLDKQFDGERAHKHLKLHVQLEHTLTHFCICGYGHRMN